MNCAICGYEQHYCNSCNRIDYLDAGFCARCWENSEAKNIYEAFEKEHKALIEKRDRDLETLIVKQSVPAKRVRPKTLVYTAPEAIPWASSKEEWLEKCRPGEFLKPSDEWLEETIPGKEGSELV